VNDQPLISIVIPVYNEGEAIVTLLDDLRTVVAGSHETLLVYDFDEDTTLGPSRRVALTDRTIRLVRNEHGRGVLGALATGLRMATGDVICVVMGDRSDDLTQVDELVQLVRSGNAIASASRYMKGGRQVGGPRLKRLLSRMAGVSLHHVAGLGTHDATNNYKAYSANFIQSVEIQSTAGFELALELTAKAHAAGEPIVEIPTVWRDRTDGESNFKLIQWLPAYLRWYWFALKHARRSRTSPA
jgi:glycosyltransferase involved in cell wall biosynthesis